MKMLSHPGLDLQVKRRRKTIPIKTLLITGFLISRLIPTLVVSFVSYRTTLKEMKEQVFRQLESVRNIEKVQIFHFFNERIANISTKHRGFQAHGMTLSGEHECFRQHMTARNWL